MSDTRITAKNVQAQLQAQQAKAPSPNQQPDADKLRADLDTLNTASGFKEIWHADKAVQADLKQIAGHTDHLDTGQVQKIGIDSAAQTNSHMLSQYLQSGDNCKLSDGQAQGYLNNAYCVWARNSGRDMNNLQSKQDFAKFIAPSLQQEGVGPDQIQEMLTKVHTSWKPPGSNRV